MVIVMSVSVPVRPAESTPSDKIAKEVLQNAQNVSTEEASEKEGAWLQKENEDCRRQACSQEKTRKGQKETDLLIRALWKAPT